VVVGHGGAILTSVDGVTWTSQNSTTTTDLIGITFGDNNFVAVGDVGTILTSADGVVWQRRSSPTTAMLFGAGYADHTFVAVGSGGTIIQTGPPTILCPGNVTVNADFVTCGVVVPGIAPAEVDPAATVTYSLSGATTGSGIGDASGVFCNLGITTITYVATGASGLASTCSFQVIVSDATPPTISECPTPQIPIANVSCQAPVPDFTTGLTIID
jgi:HYR domain